MLYDIVLGGVLSATFIPVFVDRLANRSEDEAFESISAVVTVSVVVLLVVTTVAALVAAPVPHRRPHRARYACAAPTRSTASCSSARWPPTFLRWFVIQIAAYGLFALGAALLNTRRRFVAVAWAPIVNNLVCIGILVWFGLWAGHGASLASVELHHSPSWSCSGSAPRSGSSSRAWPSCPACAGPTSGCCAGAGTRATRRCAPWPAWAAGRSASSLANQIALFVVTVLAGSVAGPDPVSSYTYAYAFFQLPYGIVAVTVMSVVTPDLAERGRPGNRPPSSGA